MDTKKTSKAYAICYVMKTALDAGERFLTKNEILVRAHKFQTDLGVKLAEYCSTSNSCYFSPTGRANGGKASVVFKGLVRKAGTRGHALVYTLTYTGLQLVS